MPPSPSATVESPDSPTSPSPVGSPLFMPPPQPKSLPSLSSTSDPGQAPADSLPADPNWSTSDSEPSDPGPGATSDTPSTGSGVKLSKSGLRTGIGTGFRQVCKLVAAYLADEEERELGVWTPDPDDVEDISRPAANIVYRRLPDEARGGDLIDIVALGLALAGYVGKNLRHKQQIRTVRQLQAAQGISVSSEGVNAPTGAAP